ncbi:DExH-box splicing factor binding site-domain-containing protein [Xylariales sp. PMI_506]|nr:DExH-box splicing factor binding site-domain-containing protein [Xylariales sp. PMI_506]
MPDSTSTPQAPRIAIKFGGAPTSSSKPPSSARLPLSSSLGKRSRPHALNQDSDSDEEERHGRHEVVTSFGANGAENETKRRDAKAARTEAKPLVIACQVNRDWKSDAKAQRDGKVLLPHERERQQRAQAAQVEPADQDKDIKWGLTVTKKTLPGDSLPSNQAPNQVESTPTESKQTKPAAQDIDQHAMDALLGKDNKEKLVISAPVNLTEAEVLQRDFQAVGEVSSLEEYSQIPDGEFGLAMLRGMGFDGKGQGTKPKEVKRRPHLLGLGAKEDEEIKKAELAQKHGHRERRPRLDEYRREKEKERQTRDDRYSRSYKNERERDRDRPSRSYRNDGPVRDTDRPRDRDRDQDSHRYHNRNSRR